MNKNSFETKICSVCGIRKPLMDFIVDPSKRLKEYSKICQKCRHKATPADADDDEGGGGKGKKLSIDYFAKRFMAQLHEEWLSDQKGDPLLEIPKEGDDEQTDKKSDKDEKSDKESEEEEKSEEKQEDTEKNSADHPDDSQKTLANNTDNSSAIRATKPPTSFGVFNKTFEQASAPQNANNNAISNDPSGKIETDENQKTTQQNTEKSIQQNTEKSTTAENDNRQTTTQQESFKTDLFKRENAQDLIASGLKRVDGITHSSTQMQMFEKYAKIENPKQQPMPKAIDNQSSKSHSNADHSPTPKKTK